MLKSLTYYKANPTAITIKYKSLEALLLKHLETNGQLRDSFTDDINRRIAQCSDELKGTYWTEDTEELEKRWSMSEEEINKIKNNIKYVK